MGALKIQTYILILTVPAMGEAAAQIVLTTLILRYRQQLSLI